MRLWVMGRKRRMDLRPLSLRLQRHWATRPSASSVRCDCAAPVRLRGWRGICGQATCPLTVPTPPEHTGGLALLTNNVTGPGVAALPLVFVSAGWFPALLLLAVLSLTSAAASLLLCDAIRALPGNADLGRRVELLSAVQELLPRWAYWGAFATFLARHAPLSPSAARSR